ncbi:MAG: hypothetical protein ACREID_06815, partial [Planctomycetota bacterium]
RTRTLLDDLAGAVAGHASATLPKAEGLDGPAGTDEVRGALRGALDRAREDPSSEEARRAVRRAELVWQAWTRRLHCTHGIGAR